MKSTQYKVRNPIRFAAFVIVVALSLSLIALSYADSIAINFEAPAYTTGSIDGQNGWAGTNGVPILPVIDQEIVANGSGVPAAFGAQSWRFSNAWQDGQFGLWPFSPSLTNEAGETSAANDGMSNGVRQTHYEFQFQFTSADPSGQQVGLQMSTASDRGDGARMTFIRMEDRADGLAVVFADYQDMAPFGSFQGDVVNGCGAGGDNFILTTVASGLSRGDAHTVKLTIDFVDGSRNDIVNVYVNGALVHTGTTWEDFFRYCEGNPTRTVDSQIFQARGGVPNPGVAGRGFLLDNLSYSTARTPVTANDCKKGGWQNVTRADGSPFKNQGDCTQYVNTGK